MNPATSNTASPASTLALGRHTLDLCAGELLDAQGELAGLRKQALEVLLVLGHRCGHVVGKEELMSQVWPGVVVGEGSLTQAIADIRRVLGDDDHRLVRNVMRRGYMLTPDEPRTAPGGMVVPRQSVAAVSSDSRRNGRRWAALLGVTVAIVLASWLSWRGTATSWQSPADLARAPLPREVPPLSIIVLPLTIHGGASDAEWLADALHGDLVIAVSQLQNSHVIARDTASTYKGKAVDPRQVAREMGVRHVVSGSLRREGARVQLNLSLVDGETGLQRWAHGFDFDRAELARAVGDFMVSIQRTLVAELYRSSAQRSATLSPTEVTADDLAIQGFALWYRGVTRENVLAARALFDRAVEMNPDSARAWAGINFTTAQMLFNGWVDDRSAATRRAEQATENLERLDLDGTYTYGAKAFRLFQKRDFPAALRLTTEWASRYRLPTAFGAQGGAMIFNGHFDEAVPVLERTLRLGARDPLRAEWQYRLAVAHFGAGRYELARDWSQTAINTSPATPWPPIHAAALHRLGLRQEAQRAFDEHMRRHPGFVAGRIQSRMPSDEPAHAEMRARLTASLRDLGLRD